MALVDAGRCRAIRGIPDSHSACHAVRPALERLRDVVAGIGVDVVLCYSPDRLARKLAYQALVDRGVPPGLPASPAGSVG